LSLLLCQHNFVLETRRQFLVPRWNHITHSTTKWIKTRAVQIQLSEKSYCSLNTEHAVAHGHYHKCANDVLLWLTNVTYIEVKRYCDILGFPW
jgi:hypothetical protein